MSTNWPRVAEASPEPRAISPPSALITEDYQRVAGDHPLERWIVDPGQLVPQKGQVAFEAPSFCGCRGLRQLHFAGADQFFDDLAGGARVLKIGRRHDV